MHTEKRGCACPCDVLNDLDDDVTECIHQTHHASYWGPDEYCEQDTVPGTKYCPRHTDQNGY